MTVRLTKAELLGRLTKRASGRYGVPIKESWLDDLIKDGLVDGLDRGVNRRQAPQYYGTACHYRRILQVVRLHAYGVRSRDALVLQLFIRGYGVPSYMVGTAAQKILSRTFRRLDRSLRSNYFDKGRNAGPKKEDIVSRQLGVIDPRLKDVELPFAHYLQAAQDARRPALGGSDLFKGMLLPGAPHLERLSKASPRELETAAALFRVVIPLIFEPPLAKALLNTSEIVAMLLAQFLMMSDEGFSLGPAFDRLLDEGPFRELVRELPKLFEK